MKIDLTDINLRSFVAILCTIMLVPGDTARLHAAARRDTDCFNKCEKVKLPPEQLDSLVAPIALFPDPLLAQTLSASNLFPRNNSAPTVAREEQTFEG